MKELDKRVLSGLTGQERLKVLLREAGFETYRDFAVAIGRYVEEVSMTLKGHRRYDEIRDALAERLGLKRSEIDQMIDGSKPAERSA